MITVYDWFGYDLPTQERYRLIKQAGFDGVLMYWSDDLGNTDYRNGPQLAQKAGLFIENIHTTINNTKSLWFDDLNGEALLDYYLQCVSDCAFFKIPTMVLHPEKAMCRIH